MERYPSLQGDPPCQGEGGVRGGDREHDRTDNTAEAGGEYVLFVFRLSAESTPVVHWDHLRQLQDL